MMADRLCSLGPDQFSDGRQQFFQLHPALGKERVGDDAPRHLVPRRVSTADGDHRNFRKTSPHDGEKFKSRHLWHIEIRDDDVRSDASELSKSVKAMFRCTHVISGLYQQARYDFTDARLIVYHQDSVLGNIGQGQRNSSYSSNNFSLKMLPHSNKAALINSAHFWSRL